MNQKIMNNGKFYIGILNNENNSLGIGKDSNYNNFVYIKALNLDKNAPMSIFGTKIVRPL